MDKHNKSKSQKQTLPGNSAFIAPWMDYLGYSYPSFINPSRGDIGYTHITSCGVATRDHNLKNPRDLNLGGLTLQFFRTSLSLAGAVPASS